RAERLLLAAGHRSAPGPRAPPILSLRPFMATYMPNDPLGATLLLGTTQGGTPFDRPAFVGRGRRAGARAASSRGAPGTRGGPGRCAGGPSSRGGASWGGAPGRCSGGR